MITKKNRNIATDVALQAVMVAIIEVSKVALAWAPNIELTSFWIIIFTLYWGKRIFFVIPVFIIIEGLIYGIHLWWIMYIYTWPILAIIILLFRKSKSAITFSIISGIFGLMFGLLCSIPYIFTGSIGADLSNGLRTAFAWWVAGIPWDLVHGIGNFVLMLVLYHPVTRVMNKIKLFQKQRM